MLGALYPAFILMEPVSCEHAQECQHIAYAIIQKFLCYETFIRKHFVLKKVPRNNPVLYTCNKCNSIDARCKTRYIL